MHIKIAILPFLFVTVILLSLQTRVQEDIFTFIFLFGFGLLASIVASTGSCALWGSADSTLKFLADKGFLRNSKDFFALFHYIVFSSSEAFCNYFYLLIQSSSFFFGFLVITLIVHFQKYNIFYSRRLPSKFRYHFCIFPFNCLLVLIPFYLSIHLFICLFILILLCFLSNLQAFFSIHCVDFSSWIFKPT